MTLEAIKRRLESKYGGNLEINDDYLPYTKDGEVHYCEYIDNKLHVYPTAIVKDDGIYLRHIDSKEVRIQDTTRTPLAWAVELEIQQTPTIFV